MVIHLDWPNVAQRMHYLLATVDRSTLDQPFLGMGAVFCDVCHSLVSNGFGIGFEVTAAVVVDFEQFDILFALEFLKLHSLPSQYMDCKTYNFV